MSTYQDYMLEMQERTAKVAEMRAQAQVPRREAPRYGRLLAWLGSAVERIGRELQAPRATVPGRRDVALDSRG
jgi:hypothetical protein